jgi:hypothetical protein
MMAALDASETTVLTRPTMRNIPKDGILEIRLKFITFAV